MTHRSVASAKLQPVQSDGFMAENVFAFIPITRLGLEDAVP